MRLLFKNHIQNAFMSLKNNRVRSGLTMLGVTIGIASITTILAISSGASKIVSNQIDQLGGNIAVIRPGGDSDLSTDISLQPNSSYAASTLLESDISILRGIPHIEAVAPLMKLRGTIKADSIAPKESTILATTPDLEKIAQLKLHDGQFLSNTIGPKPVVVGMQLSINIFGTDTPIGKTMKIKGKPFMVMGVLSRVNEPINYDSTDFDNAALINFEDGKSLNQNVAQIQQIDVKSDSIANLDRQVDEMKEALRKNHDGEYDFTILTGDKISRPNSQLFYTIASVTTAIATISLIVGGIGIMNIMLVTVTERTREIGIRKAIGASNNDISWQFLIESLAISVSGGIIGYLVGYIIAFSISGSLNFTPAVNWQIAFAALFISIVMGLTFGFYPAFRAAHKDPIDSLSRHD